MADDYIPYSHIQICPSRDSMLTEQSQVMLSDYYLLPDETPQEGFARAALAYCEGDYDLAQRIYDYVSKGWFMFASPVLSNAPREGEDPRAMPISCFLNYVPDTREGLIDHSVESRWLTLLGGGVGSSWSDVRSLSDKSPGPVPFMKTMDADMSAYRQGMTRKGSYAAYLDVSHPDIEEFVKIRIPTGDINRKCLGTGFHNAVCIPDSFMEAVENDLDWDLIDPNDGSVRDTISARMLWEEILETRFRTGEPYILFSDTANRLRPEVYKKNDLFVTQSNLCSEIMLATNKDRTAVCCLSSVNVERYDEWKDSFLIPDLVEFLDNVLSFFIKHAPESLSKAAYSAAQERSIGIGMMGWHYYLQKNNVPFESEEARQINIKIWKDLKAQADVKNTTLAVRKGPCPDAKKAGLMVRCSHVFAIAPNASSGSLMGTSASIEPVPANVYTHKTRAGSHNIKNPYLKKVLAKYGMDTESVWSNVIAMEGSIQHLEQLSHHEKLVFRTAREMDQHWVVQHVADRTPYVCQAQSLNVYFPAKADRDYVNSVHRYGFESGVKTFYYLRSETKTKAEKVSQKVERDALVDFNDNEPEECLACEG